MRLINTVTYVLEDFSSKPKPRYAILSHRWTDIEVSYGNAISLGIPQTPGSDKILNAAKLALSHDIDYLWVDTCCIDKSSSAELSEAINSMFNWYKSADRCYVYLHDVDQQTSLQSSEWFTRGWTLQELLAPSTVMFFNQDWFYLGDKTSLLAELSRASGIDSEALFTGDLDEYSVAQKMSWASTRVTERPEDKAYCLMGLFNVNMPLLYGEGERAFQRLQEEILKDEDDYTIFAWSMNSIEVSGLLAPSPSHFANCGKMIRQQSSSQGRPFSMTNRGLSIELRITPWSADTYLAYLDCYQTEITVRKVWRTYRTGIFLRRCHEDDQYARIKVDGQDTRFERTKDKGLCDRPTILRQLFVRKHISSSNKDFCINDRIYGYQLPAWFQTPFGRDNDTVSLQDGSWGLVVTSDTSARYRGLIRITLGFDFDFHPICLLQDSFSGVYGIADVCHQNFDWSVTSPQDLDWHAVNNGKAARRANHNGFWAFRGDRHHGLLVEIDVLPSDLSFKVSLKCQKINHSLVWKLTIYELFPS